MHILTCSFNYEKTPIEVREKLAFSDHEIDLALKKLREEKGILETVLFSTCNRTEIYVVVDDVDAGRTYLSTFISLWFRVEKTYFEPYMLIKENEEAIEHIFRLASGLQSMVIGETQILGQVRDAFLRAQKMGLTKKLFNELFKRAVTLAKRAHQHTQISAHAVSISYATVELAKEMYGELSSKRVVIIGAGEMAQLAIRHLQSAGVTDIQVINRTFERAQQVAKLFNIEAVPFEEMYTCVSKADICISSTSSGSPIVTKDALEPTFRQRSEHQLFLVDIAVPRDIEGSVRTIDGVLLYDIDDLQHTVDRNLAARKEAATQVQEMITVEITAFKEWVKTLSSVPILTALREKGSDIQTSVLQSIYRKIPDLTNREKEVLEKHTISIVNQLLKQPILQTKKSVGESDADQFLSVTSELFGLDEKVLEEVQVEQEKYKHFQAKATNKLLPFDSSSVR